MSLVIIGHVRCEGRSFTVTFEGPNADSIAVDYINRRYSIINSASGFCDVTFHEPEDDNGRPVEVPDTVHRALYPLEYALCPHNMSLANCYGPDHWCRPEEIAMGW
ncbi:hypothetical protein [Lentzea jiangxiensis]|uniref:Uncharacterized protein n=1 Tax=Lentzea jiangxiensis TaxID=641025 RepID=A0A1H0X4I2_9PSEU|nr:hypothetical protein [Lentzea jiangxiensis]SDP97800.1 hypothetical protein SAMN05421507_1348 [Lentzea jiangxiensis]